MSKNIFIDSYGGNLHAALAENGKLLEYHIESLTTSKIVGNIYKGQVINVVSGMQAAFVNIGLTKNGYLYVGDMLVDRSELDGSIDIPTTLNLNVGDEIMVQAMKDASGSKGARLTSVISYAGRYVVYLPNFDFIGISRKITDENRRSKLQKFAEKNRDKGGGLILRTASEWALKRDIKKEIEHLREMHKAALKKFSAAKAGEVVHEEGDLATRMLRDVYTGETEKIYVNSREIYEKLNGQTLFFKADKMPEIELYSGERDMLKQFGLSGELSKLLSRRVDLKSGAYLIIDKTEALTVIDVNTGKFTDGTSLEDTVFQTNILAAAEVARQVRLRNISGIIVVDFIDMMTESHREAVLNELGKALKLDRVKCNVVGMSPLGLVEFTRKKVRNDLSAYILKECPYCEGEGKIHSRDYTVMRIRTALLDLFADGYHSVIIDLNYDLCRYILSSRALSKDAEKIWADKRIYLIEHRTYHEHTFKIRGDNSRVLDVPMHAKILY